MWRTEFYSGFSEVVPIEDAREHWLGDECWCNPRLEFVVDGNPPLMFVHHALDKRL